MGTTVQLLATVKVLVPVEEAVINVPLMVVLKVPPVTPLIVTVLVLPVMP